MGYVLIPYNWKECLYHRGCSFSIQSVLENGLIRVDMKARKGGKLPSSHHLTLLVEIPTKKNLVMITQLQPQSLETYSGCRLLDKIIPSTRSRIAILADEVTCSHRERSCASRLHLQSYLSKGRSNTVRKTLNPSTCAKSHTESKLAFAAAVYL